MWYGFLGSYENTVNRNWIEIFWLNFTAKLYDCHFIWDRMAWCNFGGSLRIQLVKLHKSSGYILARPRLCPVLIFNVIALLFHAFRSHDIWFFDSSYFFKCVFFFRLHSVFFSLDFFLCRVHLQIVLRRKESIADNCVDIHAEWK